MSGGRSSDSSCIGIDLLGRREQLREFGQPEAPRDDAQRFEHGGQFTLKVYGSELVRNRDGEQQKRVILRPDSTDPRFAPIVLEDLDDDSFQILAEHVATF